MPIKISSILHVGLLTLALACGGCQRGTPPESAALAVSNTYLEAALRDLLDQTTPVLRLTEPGMCPGHFDLRPSQIDALRGCRLLLRLDFQTSLDAKLNQLTQRGLRIAPVTPTGGLGQPSSYLATCRQVADVLVDLDLVERDAADERLAAIEQRLAEHTTWAQQRIAEAKLNGAPVVASVHQAALCRFLGLDIVATFSGADRALAGEIDRALEQATVARMVIANRPEGRRLADALGTRLGVPVVVFGNFPDLERHDGRFDRLFRDNVQRLVDAATP